MSQMDSNLQSLIEEIAHLKLMLSASPGNFYWKDLQGIYQFCNDNQAEFLGFSSGAEIIGKTDFDLPWKDQAKNLQEMDHKVIQEERTICSEEPVVSASGEPTTFFSSKKPFRSPSGKIIGILGFSIDINKQKKLE